MLSDALTILMQVIGERRGVDQLLHGQRHPLLATRDGSLFIDQTCCHGHVELDPAHAPERVDQHYGDVERDLVRECRPLMLVMISTWRCDNDDHFPNWRRLGTEWLRKLRTMWGLLRRGPRWLS